MNEIKRLPIRQTRLGASTKNLVYVKEKEGWKRLKPMRVEMSKSGHHGEEIYMLNSDDYVIITLSVSNSGKRNFDISVHGEGEKYLGALFPLLWRWERGEAVRIEELERVFDQ